MKWNTVVDGSYAPLAWLACVSSLAWKCSPFALCLADLRNSSMKEKSGFFKEELCTELHFQPITI